MRTLPILPKAEKRRSLLPATTVTCPLPVNVVPGDEPLFHNALMAQLPPVRLRKVHAAKVVPALGPCYWGGALQEAQFRPPRLRTHAQRAIAYWTTRADPIALDTLFWITTALSHNYFHWLVEVLPKLSLICTLFDRCNILLPAQYENTSFVTQSLQTFPEANILYLSERQAVSIPYLYLISPVGHPKIIHELRRRILDYLREPTLSNAHCRRAEGMVYISRANQNKRRIVNETCLIRSIHSLGYNVKLTEELSFAEQVNLMQNTIMLLGPHGAGLTNMIFMPAGSTVIEIRGDADSKNNGFFWLASILGHKYYYITAKCIPLKLAKTEYLANDLLVDVPLLLSIIKQAVKDARPAMLC